MQKKELNRIKKWIESRKFTFRYGNIDMVDYEKFEVTLRRNQGNIIYSALHECGHISMGSKKDFPKKFKSILKADLSDGRHYRSNLYKCNKIKEEMDAWEEGLKISKKLKIKIDKEKYNKMSAKCVMTYVKYL